MSNPFRSLRLRLVCLNLLVFGAFQIGLSSVLLFLSENFIRWDLNQRLLESAEDTAALIDVRGGPGESKTVHRAATRPSAKPKTQVEHYYQVRLSDGTPVFPSDSPQDVELPFSERAQRASQQTDGVFETVRGAVAVALSPESERLQIVTIYVAEGEENPFYLQAAIGTESADRTIARLRRAALWTVPAGLIVAALASWMLMRRALNPIGRVAKEARALTAAYLDRRLPVPPGGDELAEMVETLNEMLGRLESAFAAQERFVANAAHELRTPVTHLLAEAQVLSRQARPAEEMERFASSVQAEMRSMSQIVESLLLLARADAGIPAGSRRIVSINDVVTEAIERCHPHARQRETPLVPRLPEGALDDPNVEGDFDLLVALVSNLLRNAIRFSPPGERVEIEVRLERSEVVVEVSDRGPGIAPERLPHIFERFYQVVRDGEEAKGTGLGLAIASSVAKLHGGGIEARNRVPTGCVFTVRLPRSVRDESATAAGC
jgi:two-component system OmpR family sensor kinase